MSGGEREVCVLAGDLFVVLGVFDGVEEDASVCVCDIVTTWGVRGWPEIGDMA